jgi:carboxymethylenebutenolidase
MRTERVQIPAEGAEIDAYLAVPDGPGPWPGIIVIHEIWGLVPHIEDVARRFADAGYTALAPDLYSRGGLPVTPEEIGRAMAFMQAVPVEERADADAVGRHVAELPAGDRDVVQRALAWLQTRDLGGNVADLRAALGWLASQPFVDPRHICSLGFCMGGGLSARLAASGVDLAGAVVFYGEHPPADEIANIRCRMLGLYGGEDHRITDGVPELARAMAAAGKRFEYHVYAGAPHAFFNDTREATYRPEAARDAWARVLAFQAAAG